MSLRLDRLVCSGQGCRIRIAEIVVYDLPQGEVRKFVCECSLTPTLFQEVS